MEEETRNQLIDSSIVKTCKMCYIYYPSRLDYGVLAHNVLNGLLNYEECKQCILKLLKDIARLSRELNRLQKLICQYSKLIYSLEDTSYMRMAKVAVKNTNTVPECVQKVYQYLKTSKMFLKKTMVLVQHDYGSWNEKLESQMSHSLSEMRQINRSMLRLHDHIQDNTLRRTNDVQPQVNGTHNRRKRPRPRRTRGGYRKIPGRPRKKLSIVMSTSKEQEQNCSSSSDEQSCVDDIQTAIHSFNSSKEVEILRTANEDSSGSDEGSQNEDSACDINTASHKRRSSYIAEESSSYDVSENEGMLYSVPPHKKQKIGSLNVLNFDMEKQNMDICKIARPSKRRYRNSQDVSYANVESSNIGSSEIVPLEKKRRGRPKKSVNTLPSTGVKSLKVQKSKFGESTDYQEKYRSRHMSRSTSIRKRSSSDLMSRQKNLSVESHVDESASLQKTSIESLNVSSNASHTIPNKDIKPCAVILNDVLQDPAAESFCKLLKQSKSPNSCSSKDSEVLSPKDNEFHVLDAVGQSDEEADESPIDDNLESEGENKPKEEEKIQSWHSPSTPPEPENSDSAEDNDHVKSDSDESGDENKGDHQVVPDMDGDSERIVEEGSFEEVDSNAEETNSIGDELDCNETDSKMEEINSDVDEDTELKAPSPPCGKGPRTPPSPPSFLSEPPTSEADEELQSPDPYGKGPRTPSPPAPYEHYTRRGPYTPPGLPPDTDEDGSSSED